MNEKIEKLIRDVPDFPKPGIIFKDITPLLNNPEELNLALGKIADLFSDKKITHVASMESRGFLFGVPLALRLNAGFVPIRKPGKLPCATQKKEYTLEYGTDALEIHKDAMNSSSKTLIIDDLLATGGTAQAACELVESLGAEVVGVGFLIELAFLKGRNKLGGRNVKSLITY